MGELYDSAQDNGEIPSKRKTVLDPSRKNMCSLGMATYLSNLLIRLATYAHHRARIDMATYAHYRGLTYSIWYHEGTGHASDLNR